MKNDITVIIPALNEEKYIGKCIDSLLKQTYANFKIIVIDNGSEDHTVDIVKKYKNIKLIIEKNKGVARARNKGVKFSNSDILFFIDADTIPSLRVLEYYHNLFKQDKNIIAATGPIEPLEKTTFKIKFSYFAVSRIFVPFLILIKRPLIIGHNFCVRKKYFEKAGRFNENYITYEDWDLSTKLQKYGKIKFVNEALVYTSIRRTVKWGIKKYLFFTLENIVRYGLFRKPKENYEPIR